MEVTHRAASRAKDLGLNALSLVRVDFSGPPATRL
jgi:hypothetical protein